MSSPPAPPRVSERYRTAVVATIVMVLAAAAVVDRGRTGVLTVGACDEAGATPGERVPAGAIAALLGYETGRAVRLACADGDVAAAGAELVVVPALEFARLRADGHVALFAARGHAPSDADRAVLVARRGASVDPSEVTAGDVVFQSADQVNGCWQQLRWLVEKGAGLPVDPRGLVFAPSPGRAERVVLEVILGDRALGACRLSDLQRLWEAGIVRRDEVAVLFDAPALPEWIVACGGADRKHFERVLSGLPSSLERAPGALVRTLRERGVGGFEPVAPAALDALDTLAEFARREPARAGMP
ncbi:MAG: hypothetical protein OEO21_04205 [Candidatus Krumholzibacteria bacterium]|nr:hypothetical protein [Candidatus Krumholzibacteria bacterium]